jgi:hypothetical protein
MRVLQGVWVVEVVKAVEVRWSALPWPRLVLLALGLEGALGESGSQGRFFPIESERPWAGAPLVAGAVFFFFLGGGDLRRKTSAWVAPVLVGLGRTAAGLLVLGASCIFVKLCQDAKRGRVTPRQDFQILCSTFYAKAMAIC